MNRCMSENFKEFERSVRFLIAWVSMLNPTSLRFILFDYFKDFFNQAAQVRRSLLQVNMGRGKVREERGRVS